MRDAMTLSTDESEEDTEQGKNDKQERFAEHDAERCEGNVECSAR